MSNYRNQSQSVSGADGANVQDETYTEGAPSADSQSAAQAAFTGEYRNKNPGTSHYSVNRSNSGRDRSGEPDNIHAFCDAKGQYVPANKGLDEGIGHTSHGISNLEVGDAPGYEGISYRVGETNYDQRVSDATCKGYGEAPGQSAKSSFFNTTEETNNEYKQPRNTRQHPTRTSDFPNTSQDGYNKSTQETKVYTDRNEHTGVRSERNPDVGPWKPRSEERDFRSSGDKTSSNDPKMTYTGAALDAAGAAAVSVGTAAAYVYEEGSAAVYGKTESTEIARDGVYGKAESTNIAGDGVSGQAESMKVVGDGVSGQAESMEIARDGVYGKAESTNIARDGVSGQAESMKVVGDGVSGQAESMTVVGDGVSGQTESMEIARDGVYGKAESTNIAGDGVSGQAESMKVVGDGVSGQAESMEIARDGVYGKAESTNIARDGVSGQAESMKVVGDGVSGQAESMEIARDGVYGKAESTNITRDGVFGQAESMKVVGDGVSGQAESMTVVGDGVSGQAESMEIARDGVYGKAESTNIARDGVSGQAESMKVVGDGVSGQAESMEIAGDGVYGKAESTQITRDGVSGQAVYSTLAHGTTQQAGRSSGYQQHQTGSTPEHGTHHSHHHQSSGVRGLSEGQRSGLEGRSFSENQRDASTQIQSTDNRPFPEVGTTQIRGGAGDNENRPFPEIGQTVTSRYQNQNRVPETDNSHREVHTGLGGSVTGIGTTTTRGVLGQAHQQHRSDGQEIGIDDIQDVRGVPPRSELLGTGDSKTGPKLSHFDGSNADRSAKPIPPPETSVPTGDNKPHIPRLSKGPDTEENRRTDVGHRNVYGSEAKGQKPGFFENTAGAVKRFVTGSNEN